MAGVAFAQIPQIDTVVVGEDFTYEGKWPEGEGVLYSYQSGLVIGTFKEGIPEGKCIGYGPNGRKYWGEYRNGKWNGHGCTVKTRGAIVTGEFQNGKQHGTDTVFRTDGSVLIGEYEKGKCINTIREYDFAPKKIRAAKPSFPEIELNEKQAAFMEDFNRVYKERREQKKAGEVKPKFMGMHANMFSKWVNGQLRYPPQARKDKAQGAPVLQFTITTEGKVTDVKIKRSSGHYALDDEAVRVVSSSPDWTPGMQDGKPKEMTLTFPVIFSLR